MTEWKNIHEAVEQAVAEYREWHRAALPSADEAEPRVTVVDHVARALRRPIKRGHRYFVRWAGTAELTNPRRVDGEIVFTPNWSFRP